MLNVTYSFSMQPASRHLISCKREGLRSNSKGTTKWWQSQTTKVRCNQNRKIGSTCKLSHSSLNKCRQQIGLHVKQAQMLVVCIKCLDASCIEKLYVTFNINVNYGAVLAWPHELEKTSTQQATVKFAQHLICMFVMNSYI